MSSELFNIYIQNEGTFTRKMSAHC